MGTEAEQSGGVVRRTYPGWSREAALQHFLAMREFRTHVIGLGDAHFPFREDWRALHAIVEAIDAAAEHFGLDHHGLYAVSDTSRATRTYFKS